MIITKISILSILFIFAIGTHAWSDSDKSMNDMTNRTKAMKTGENKGVLQKKKKPPPRPVTSTKKGSDKSESALCRHEDREAIAHTKNDVDFLKAVEEKRKARRIDLDQVIHSPGFLRSTYHNDLLISSGAPVYISSKIDFSESTQKPFLLGSNTPEGRTGLEVLRHLEAKKQEILRELFMGLRFSFTPTGRHIVLEMNVAPSSQKGPGLIIPF